MMRTRSAAHREEEQRLSQVVAEVLRTDATRRRLLARLNPLNHSHIQAVLEMRCQGVLSNEEIRDVYFGQL